MIQDDTYGDIERVRVHTVKKRLKAERRGERRDTPIKSIKISTCLFLNEKAGVNLRCSYNIYSNSVAIAQDFVKSWEVRRPIPTNLDITIVRKRVHKVLSYASDGRVSGQLIGSSIPLSQRPHHARPPLRD